MEQTRKYIYDGTKNISYRYNQIIRFDKTAFTTTQKKKNPIQNENKISKAENVVDSIKV